MGEENVASCKVAFGYFTGGTEVRNMFIGKLVRGEDSNWVYLLL
jgi:hypothetical protein